MKKHICKRQFFDKSNNNGSLKVELDLNNDIRNEKKKVKEKTVKRSQLR